MNNLSLTQKINDPILKILLLNLIYLMHFPFLINQVNSCLTWAKIDFAQDFSLHCLRGLSTTFNFKFNPTQVAKEERLFLHHTNSWSPESPIWWLSVNSICAPVVGIWHIHVLRVRFVWHYGKRQFRSMHQPIQAKWILHGKNITWSFRAYIMTEIIVWDEPLLELGYLWCK